MTKISMVSSGKQSYCEIVDHMIKDVHFCVHVYI